MVRAESCAGIGDAQIDPIAMSRQLNLGLRSSAVLHDIPQGLLHDPKQAQRYVLWNPFWNIVIDKLD